jgi:hypothetical protein
MPAISYEQASIIWRSAVEQFHRVTRPEISNAIVRRIDNTRRSELTVELYRSYIEEAILECTGEHVVIVVPVHVYDMAGLPDRTNFETDNVEFDE